MPDDESTKKPAVIPLDARVLEAILSGGVSMEDIARLKDPDVRTPTDALDLLKRGNERFFTGQVRRPEVHAFDRRAQIMAQTPFAVVLGCSDSRVPIEIVFDQGLGDLFIVRVAGQIVEPATEASIEYAVTRLNCRLIVVMGHEGCGAVQAALAPPSEFAGASDTLRSLIDRIRPAVADLPEIRDAKARTREAVVRHLLAERATLRRNPVVQAAEAAGEVQVVGAFYEISSGVVEIFEEQV
jgi:carbonic anhydrase